MSAVRLAKTAIKIPRRIERGPTDILKALASTVKHIPSEPESFLQDDPYLLPRRPADRRRYSLAKLYGIKTAKFFLNKRPELFGRDDAEPKVEAFMPKEEFNSEMEFTEADIKWCIENKDAANGVIAYKYLEEKKIKINDETLLQFFELLCYTNEESLMDLEEYATHRLAPDSEGHVVNEAWKTAGLASKIFNRIKGDLDPVRVYSAMIAGLGKFNEHATAKQVFDDFCEHHPNMGLCLAAYESLLNSIPRLNSSVSTAAQAVDDIVKHMSENLVMPNLMIFNSILKCYSSFQCNEEECQLALQLLNDMKTLNIKPSLSTFASVIVILTRYKNGKIYGELIEDILTHIDQSKDILDIRDNRDPEFFRLAMESIAYKMNNLKLARKLYTIYMKKPNLFDTLRNQSRFLNNYFKLMVTTDSLNNMVEFYDSHVPSRFQPTVDTYEAFAEALDLYQADKEVIRRVGQDLVEFDLAKRLKNDALFRKDPLYVEAFEKKKKGSEHN